MPGRFLITGLPRCRTAWLSVAATEYRSICYHEPTQFLPEWRDIERIWSGNRYAYIGISDHGLGFHLAEILNRWTPRTLIVERGVREVEAALAAAFPGQSSPGYCPLLAERLAEIPEHPLVRRVSFQALGDTEEVFRCLRHLMPEARLDYVRLQELQRMNIQVDREKVLAAAKARAGDAGRLLGQDVVEILSRARAAVARDDGW